MRHIRLQLSVVLLLGLGLTSIQAQPIYVKHTTGDQTHYAVSNIRKMTFSEGNIIITETTGSTYNYSLTGIRYLSFIGDTVEVERNSGISGIGQDKGQRIIKLYPNPFSDMLHLEFDGNTIPSRIEMLNITGSVVRVFENITSNTITLQGEDLPSGIYFIKVYADKVYVDKVLRR